MRIGFRTDPGLDRGGLEFTPSWSRGDRRLAGFSVDVSTPRHFHFTGSPVDRLGVQLLRPDVRPILAGGAKS